MAVTAPFPGRGCQTWSAHRAVILVLALVIVGAAAWAVFGIAPTDRLVAVLIALFALVGLVIATTRRLTVGPDGFAVRSLRGTRQIGWESVRSVREVDSRRMGAAGSTIEVDLIDDSLLVFGRTELGVDPRTVGPVLRRWWHRAGEHDDAGEDADGTENDTEDGTQEDGASGADDPRTQRTDERPDD